MLSEIDNRPVPVVPLACNLAGYVIAQTDHCSEKAPLILMSPQADRTLSFTQLKRLTQGCATAPLDQGLRPGDRVLIPPGNSLAFTIPYLAPQWAGLVPVPTSAAMTTSEITRLAAIVGPKLVAVYQRITLSDAPLPTLAPNLPAWNRLPYSPLHPGDPDREANVMFTSGTSESPMAVSHSHRAILTRQAMLGHWEGIRADDRTGDTARMSDDGAVTHPGRKDDLLNVGGFRVLPTEVEATFRDCPGLQTCAVVQIEPVPGTTIIALFLRLRAPSTAPVCASALKRRLLDGNSQGTTSALMLCPALAPAK